jgi:hypothetical protein
MDSKSKHGKDVNSFKCMYKQVFCNSCEKPNKIFENINKVILLLIWKCKETKISNNTFY